MIPCADGVMANYCGKWFRIVAHAIKMKPDVQYRPTLGMDAFIGHLTIESKLFTLEELSKSFLNAELRKMDDFIEAHPEAFYPIDKVGRIYQT